MLQDVAGKAAVRPRLAVSRVHISPHVKFGRFAAPVLESPLAFSHSRRHVLYIPMKQQRVYMRSWTHVQPGPSFIYRLNVAVCGLRYARTP